MSLIERVAYQVSGRSRARKWQQFLELVAPNRNEKILDIGVNTTEYSNTDNYLEKHYAHPEMITAVAVGEDLSEFAQRYPEVRVVSSDGRALPFNEGEFDISYSNAVIEHVGGRGAQERFLRECYRVARRGYLTTPNRNFPIELHTRVPLLHLTLSKPLFDRVLHLIGKPWAAGDYMDLLSEKDLRARLRAAGISKYTIIKNRFFGITMTFTVVWRK